MAEIKLYLLRPGVPGLLAGFLVFLLVWKVVKRNIDVRVRRTRAKRDPKDRDKIVEFTFEPRAEIGFEPTLKRYIELAQYMIGLATGSIVLLAGTSVFKSGGKLSPDYASPLVMLAFSVIYGVLFMAWISYKYEAFLHEEPYTPWEYCLTNVLGFSGLFSFALGYLWLIFEITN